jgi:hypothetical protein
MAKILIKSVGVFESRKRFEASVEGYNIVHGPRVTITQRWRIQKHGDQKGKRAGPNDEYEIIGEPTFEWAYKPKIHLGYSALKDAKKIASDWLLTQPDYDEAAFERRMAESMRGNPMKTKRSTPSADSAFEQYSPSFWKVDEDYERSAHFAGSKFVLDTVDRHSYQKVIIIRVAKNGGRFVVASFTVDKGEDARKAAFSWLVKNAAFSTKKGSQGTPSRRKSLKLAVHPENYTKDQKRKNGKRHNPGIGDYFHAAKRSASAAVRDVAAKAAAAAHAESKRERKVTPEQALQTLAKSLGFTVVRGNPQKELRRYVVYRLGAHPAERPLWTGNATSGRHAQIQAERATGKDVGEARLVQGGSSLLRKNSK